MNYADISKKVKQELLLSPVLLDVTRHAFDEKSEPFSFGGTVNLYQIGQLPSGLHVALRAFRPEQPEGKKSLERQMKNMEYYCYHAETLFDEKQPVPAFCVGVIYMNKAGILTEDLTCGGTQEVFHHPDDEFGFVGPEKRKVFIDIDYMFRMNPFGGPQSKYFLDDMVIKL